MEAPLDRDEGEPDSALMVPPVTGPALVAQPPLPDRPALVDTEPDHESVWHGFPPLLVDP